MSVSRFDRFHQGHLSRPTRTGRASVGLAGMALVAMAALACQPTAPPADRSAQQSRPLFINSKVQTLKLKDIKSLVESGRVFGLEGHTLTFVRLDDNNYQWQKSSLVWEADYTGTTHHLSEANQSALVTIPFTFPLYDYTHTQLTFTRLGDLKFSNLNGQTPSGACMTYEGLTEMAGCPPMIMATSKLFFSSSDSADLHVRQDNNSLLLTLIADYNPQTPMRAYEIQYRLDSQGTIRISYKKVALPSMSSALAGIWAGINESGQLAKFHDQVSGQTSASTPTGLVEFVDAPRFDLVAMAKYIQGLYPDHEVDAVFFATDFPTRRFDGNPGGSMLILHSDVLGTGYGLSDASSGTFDASKLQAVVNMADMDALNVDPAALHSGSFDKLAAHEFGHKWLAHVGAPMANDSGHWMPGTNTVTPLATQEAPYCSVMGGKAVVGGTSSSDYAFGYSSMGLYFMGLVSPEDTTPLTNGGATRTVNDYVAQLGERLPAFPFSKKTFLALIFYITKESYSSLPPTAVIQRRSLLEDYIEKFETNFKMTTQDVGQITFLTTVTMVTPDSVTRGTIPKYTKERIAFLLNYYSRPRFGDLQSLREFYKIMVGDLKMPTCLVVRCNEQPLSWPRIAWLEALETVTTTELAKVAGRIDDLMPYSELRTAIAQYQAASSRVPVSQSPHEIH